MNPIVDDKTLTVVISQSGETADTIAAMREAKRFGVENLCDSKRGGKRHSQRGGRCFCCTVGRPRNFGCDNKGVQHTHEVTAIYLLSLYIAQELNMIDDEKLKTKLDVLLKSCLRIFRKYSTTEETNSNIWHHSIITQRTCSFWEELSIMRLHSKAL